MRDSDQTKRRLVPGQRQLRFPRPTSPSTKKAVERRTVRRKRTSVPHSTRPEVSGVCHVVLRVRRGLPWLRTPRTYRVLERALRAGKEKKGFALVQCAPG